ncbi:MAG: hypothetical protein GX802_06120, partial [Clostridiales bacterium]|nr:hypothetical protein [Clostridiales bacterium]
ELDEDIEETEDSKFVEEIDEAEEIDETDKKDEKDEIAEDSEVVEDTEETEETEGIDETAEIEPNDIVEDTESIDEVAEDNEEIDKSIDETAGVNATENITELTEENEVVEEIQENNDSDKLNTKEAENKNTQSLEERIDKLSSKEEIDALDEESSDNLNESIQKQKQIEAELSKKFETLATKEVGSNEYKASLREFNALIKEKNDLDDHISELSRQQTTVHNKRMELRQAQLEKGAEAVSKSGLLRMQADELKTRFENSYYTDRVNKGDLRYIKDDNTRVMKELKSEQDSIKLAMDAKMDEITDYVCANNMSPYDTANDQHYQRLSNEFTLMKDSYEDVKYSIANLDGNNASISEVLGEQYALRSPVRSPIKEVNDGSDDPTSTNYFFDEAKANEVEGDFNQESWEKSSTADREKAVNKLAEYNAEILGIEEKPRIVFYNDKDPGVCVSYSDKHNIIYVNKRNMQNGGETANTLSHEYRHAYQNQRAGELQNIRDLDYKNGLGENYIDAADDYQKYHNQFVERDARAYADSVNNKLIEVNNRQFTYKANRDTDESLLVDEIKQQSEVPKINKSEKTFITNSGERISYKGAAENITSKAQEYLTSMNIDKHKSEEIISDLSFRIHRQQIASEARVSGDHGIRHIYGNFERSENYLATRNDVTDEQKFAVLVAQVYHDDGYTKYQKGFLDSDYDDITHDEESLRIWRENQSLYEGVISKESTDSISVAIGEHNSSAETNVTENTDANKDVIVATVHISDKLALSQREKFPELFQSDRRLTELTQRMNNLNSAVLKNPDLEFYTDKGELTQAGIELREKYQNVIINHIETQGYSQEHETRLKEAVQKDVALDSGKFFSGMNSIYCPSDCISYNNETHESEIKVYSIKNGVSSEEKQIEKMFKDFLPKRDGESDNAYSSRITQCVNAAKSAEGCRLEDRGLTFRIEAITDSEIQGLESRLYQKNMDMAKTNESFERSKGILVENKNEFIRSIELRNASDINYAEYQNACKIFSPNNAVSYSEFKLLDKEEKERALKDVITQGVLNDVKSILND